MTMTKRLLLISICFSLSLLAIVGQANNLANPFKPAVNKTFISPVVNYPLSQLTMVGTINNGEQVWGIVRAPDNHVYQVTIGNNIGIEHAQVLQVTSQQITVERNLPGQMNIETLWLSNE
jgi:Tfp pilus assembly protein PilP